MNFQEIIDRSYKAINTELNKVTFADFENKHIVVTLEPIKLDRINLYALVEVCYIGRSINVDITLDAWDIDGHKMIMPISRIIRELTKLIETKYKQEYEKVNAFDRIYD